MIFRRAKRRQNFTVLDNAILDDERLGGEEMMVLVWLLSRPDDWTVRLEVLQRRFGWSRDRIKGAFKLLKTYGYARLISIKHPKTGAFIGSEYILFDEPQEVVAGDPLDDEIEVDEAGEQPADPPETPVDKASNVGHDSYRTIRESVSPRTDGIRTGPESVAPILRTESYQISPQRPSSPPDAAISDESWSTFETLWPFGDDLSDLPSKARIEFWKLTQQQRDSALRFASVYLAEQRALDRKRKHAFRWLRDKYFEPFAKRAELSDARKPKAREVPIFENGDPWKAWATYELVVYGRVKLFAFEFTLEDGRKVRGCMRPTLYPPRAHDPPPDAQTVRPEEFAK